MKKKSLKRAHILFALAVGTLSGCASIQPVLPTTSDADANAGYVAGQFSRMKVRDYAFVIKSTDGGTEYNMSMGADSTLPTAVANQTVAIKLPPGRYSVTQWITFSTLGKEVSSRTPVTNSALNQPFTVKPGSVVHVGSHEVTERMETEGEKRGAVSMRIRARAVTQAEVHEAFATTYPNLAKLPIQCVLCVDTLRNRPAQ